MQGPKDTLKTAKPSMVQPCQLAPNGEKPMSLEVRTRRETRGFRHLTGTKTEGDG